MTLKLVAKYGDMNNVGGTASSRSATRSRCCSSTARRSAATRPRSSGRSGIGTVVIRDDRAEAERIFLEAFDRNRVAKPWVDQPVGTPEDVAEKLSRYVDLGYRHLISGFPANYDEESMTRFATEVRPLLENG